MKKNKMTCWSSCATICLFQKEYHKKLSMIEGNKPSVTGIGSPGSRNIRIVNAIEMKDPIKINNKDKLPAKPPNVTKALDTTIA